MSNRDLDAAMHRAAAEILDFIREQADGVAAHCGVNNAFVYKALGDRVAGTFEAAMSAPELDGRTARWRCRFRIYRADMMDEPWADSDDGKAPDAPGSMVLAGLPAVAAEVSMLAAAAHKTSALSGMSREELHHRLKGLRPTLSRRGGEAVWRVPYDTIESFNERKTERGWLMRVDIQRETENAK